MAKSDLLTKPFVGLCFVNFLTFFGFQMLIPIFPLYLDGLGITKDIQGFVMAAFTLTVVPIRPYTSRWLNAGHAVRCMVAGIVLCVLATGGYWLATMLLTVSLIRALHGVGFGVATVTFSTVVSRLIPANRRAEGMGYYMLSLSIAMCLGPWFGPLLYNYRGMGGVVALTAACGLLVLLLIRVIPVEEVIIKTKPFGWDSIIEKSVWFPALLFFLTGISWSAVAGYVSLFARDMGVLNIGNFFFVNAVSTLVIRLVAGRAADRFGFASVIVPAQMFFITGFVLLSQAGNQTGLLVAAVFTGTAMGVIMPVYQAWMINQSPSSRRAEAMAMGLNAFDVGLGLGFVIMGNTAFYFNSFPTMYLTAMSFSVCVLVLYAGYLIRFRDTTKRGVIR
jgi:MFS family permease